GDSGWRARRAPGMSSAARRTILLDSGHYWVRKEGFAMAQVWIRDVDPAVIDKLRARAHKNGRSLEAELRLILQRAANESSGGGLAAVQRVRAMFEGRTFSDSAELLREDRDR